MSDQCVQQCMSEMDDPPEGSTLCATVYNCYTVPSQHYRKVGLSPQQCARSLRDYETNACGESMQTCIDTCVNDRK